MATNFQTFKAALASEGFTPAYRYAITGGSRFYNMPVAMEAKTALCALGIPYRITSYRGRPYEIQVERKDADAILKGTQAPVAVQVATPATTAPKATRRTPEQIAQERAEKKAREAAREAAFERQQGFWRQALEAWKAAGNKAEGGLIGYTKDDEELRFLTPAQERQIKKMAKALEAAA